jgi:hypothetical protein
MYETESRIDDDIEYFSCADSIRNLFAYFEKFHRFRIIKWEDCNCVFDYYFAIKWTNRNDRYTLMMKKGDLSNFEMAEMISIDPMYNSF